MLYPRVLSRSFVRVWLFAFTTIFAIVLGGLNYRAAVMDPTFTQRAILTASDGASGDELGGAIAISGETVVIGARRNGSGRGAAYVFVRSGTGLIQQAKLTAADGIVGDEFGLSVAISGDTILVGAPYTSSFRGSVYVFTRSGTNWTQQARLTASDVAAGDRFGWSVALEGNNAVVGSISADIRGVSNQGAAYLFQRSETGWKEQQKLVAADGATNNSFGYDVAISNETVVVGAEQFNSTQGAAYIFVHTDTVWLQQTRLVANDAQSNTYFGHSVDLKGNTVVVGAFNTDGGKGAAYIFGRSGTTWTQQQKLSGTNGHFGARVAINGERLLVTADIASFDNKTAQGDAYLFQLVGTTWTQQQRLLASDGVARDQFGLDAAFQGDYAVIGARFRAVNGRTNQGAAYYFAPDNTAPRITPTIASLPREQGTLEGVAGIARVSDDETPAEQLTVTATPPTGITVNILANDKGTIAARVIADCTAKPGDNEIVLTVSDGRLTATTKMIVNVTANQPPSAGVYPETFIAKVGTTTVINPISKPTDNGTIKTITTTATPPGFTGTFSANLTTGVLTVTNPGPMGEYTITVTVEDNCGAKATTLFKLNVAFVPDLQVTLQNPPVDIVTDTNFNLSWMLKNAGTRRIATPFVDRVVLSRAPEPNVYNTIASFPFAQPLDPNQSAPRTQILNIPRSLVPTDGTYYLIVLTDADNVISEGAGENNNFHAVPVKVRRSLLPDLVVVPMSITVAGETIFDQEIIVTWKVKNIGNGPTNAAGWTDWVHLSTDDIPEIEDPFSIGIPNQTYLSPGEEYKSSTTFRIPRGLVGQYKIVVYADGASFFREGEPWKLIEENEKNNKDSKAFQINVPLALPDLQVTSVVAPEEARTGDKMFVTWRVKNNGTGNTPPDQKVWDDLIYLSKDTTFNAAEDRLIGSRKREEGLNKGEEYAVVSHSVDVPGNIAGDWYVFVFADGNNTLYEFDKENNNTGYDNRRAVKIIPTPLDLTVEWISVPTDSAAARQINVKWKVTNLGPNPSKVNWVDTIYLSDDLTLDPKTDKALGSVAYNSILEPTKSYEANATVSLTACITGRYYLYVFTDSANNEFELNPNYDAEANNFSKLEAVQITALPPDLQVTNLTNDNTGNAGQPFNLSYTVTNKGIGATIETEWTDRIYLSRTPTFDEKTALLAGSVPNIGNILSNNSYTRTVGVIAPTTAQGEYYVFIKTDADNRVEECLGENNNVAGSPTKINIKNNLPDFAVTGIQIQPGDNLLSGNTVTVNWTVTNAGTVDAKNTSWVDGVFFSTTNNFNNSITLAEVTKTGPVGIGASYTNQAKIRIPVVKDPGTYYLFVRADYRETVFEGQREDNNTNFIAIPVTIPPTDLAVTNVDAPDIGYSGQFVNVKWTVANNGTQAPYVSGWTDYVFLSADQIFDPQTDLSVGWLERNGALAAGASYNANLDVRIPPGITGPFYVFVQTDRNRQVADNNLANNAGYDTTPMVSQFAPPADLVVSTINPPATGAPGDKATIQWSVKNQGPNTAVGQWTDAVYLSKDTTWDSNDAVIGRVDHIGDIAKDATYNATLEAALPAVLPGEYYVIVRTDVRNFVRENDETNNAGASSAKVKLDVPELTLGVAQSGTLSFGQERYYKVNAPANETLRFTLDGNRDNKPQQPANELYARFGLLPSRSAYDFLFSRPYEPDQEIVVPDTQAGTYYSLARNAYLPASPQTDPYSIKAEILPFGLRSVSPAITGNDRYTTITIEGAKFDNQAKVRLVDKNGVTLTPIISSIKPDKIKAIFDFKTVPLGMYKAEVENPNGQKSILENAVKVENGSGAYVSVTVQAPSAIRPGRTGRFLVTLSNSGTNDAIKSFLFLQVPKGTVTKFEESYYRAYDTIKPPPPGIASWKEVPIDFHVGEISFIPMMIPIIESGKTITISVDLTPPDTVSEITLRALLLPSALVINLKGQALFNITNKKQSAILASSNPDEKCPRQDCAEALGDALIDLVKELLTTAIKDFFLDDLDKCTEGLVDTISDQLSVPFKDYLEGGISTLDLIWEMLPTRSAVTGCGSLALTFFPPAKWVQVIAKLLKGLENLEAGIELAERTKALYDIINKCLKFKEGSAATGGSCSPGADDGGGSGGGSGTSPTPRAIDPNDKIGPKGFGLPGFIRAFQNQPYHINFENISTATASAQRIRITDNLDPNLDWRTFRLKEIGFGKYRIPIPDNRAFYQGRLQLGEDLGNLVADISAGLDIATGQVTWTLTALDPKTGEQPNGADQGLLPPNDSTGRGQGYVTYTVQPKAEVKTGTVIANSATIIFDTEEPITTNTVTNTIDADVPTSAVNPLPATSTSRTFTVSWAGSDPANGAGLQSFDVWYAEGDSAYQPLLSATTDTSTTFTGQAGKSYRFYSIARDNAGNVEAAPATPDAVTTIGQVNNPVPTLASLSPNALLAGANAFTLTVTGANFVPESQVLWNGAARTTSYVSPTELTATIAAADVANAGAANVTVASPAPGGGATAALAFTIQALGYEADVSPRPNGNGNGAVTIMDWVQMGRFAAGLDTPAVGSEFQRADCAPRPTLGDGRITVSDWVQAGRYAAALDSVFVVGGLTAPLNPLAALRLPEATASTLRIGTARFARGQVVSLPIELDAQGTESGVAFTLNYDPKLMSFLDASLGAGASGATLQVNATQMANGRIGIALVLPAGQQIAAGTRSLLTVRFLPGGGDTEVISNVTFGDQLIPREISDVRAFAISQVNYVNGAVTLSGKGAATVPGASYVGIDLAPDSIASSFGAGLSEVTMSAPSLPLPTTLGGTRVLVKDSKGVERFAPLFYVSPLQVNFLLPPDTAEGIAMISVQSANGISTPGVLHVTKLAPALFAADASGEGVAAASVQRVQADGMQRYEPAYTLDAQKKPVAVPIDLGPESDQVYLLLYGSGLRLREALGNVTATIGGVPADVVYAGPQGYFVGVDQINVRLPRSLIGRKDVDVVLTVASKAANTVRVSIK